MADRVSERVKGKQGFASMPLDQRRAIAALGGKAIQASGKAHRWTHEQAVEAGRKGGQISRRRVVA